MCMVSFDVPEEVLLDLHEDQAGFTDYARGKIALDLYTERGVSLGYCADVAGMAKEEFLRYLGENGVSIFGFASEAEFKEESQNA